MDDFKTFFEGKTVTLMGLGLLGRGVGDAAFLARHCAKVFVTDMKTAEALGSSIAALAPYKNIEFVLGEHRNDLFENKDFIVKGAGVRLDNPFVAHAQDRGIPVYMSTALFARFAPLKTVGVTGTRGKTTVTCMIGDILKAGGKKVLLGGNLRGVSTLAQLETADAYDVAVLELDSWQLQGFDALTLSPNVAVMTSFYPDHMNYYDGDMERYWYDKASIFRHQKARDLLVAPQALKERIERDRPRSALRVASVLPESYVLRVPGEHNRVNASLAREASLAMGVPERTIQQALESFAGVEGRLQLVGVWRDRAFYNDSNATTQEATVAALSAFSPETVVLICGGADKGLPIDALLARLRDGKIRHVLIEGTGTDRMRPALPESPVVDTMEAAVEKAVALSRPGDHIVLSPGFASFGVFKNEYERSDRFLASVEKLFRDEEA
ncbi:MAG: UDP-N-acetylmuramoyl-L-alanine--D-glutamate ligase [Alphaproteobacteria bacterium]|nr:UDP-N-acetylmuramoyl-L-alanine--D-glutamate ligase [Alphaproteobacteria bacterium]